MFKLNDDLEIKSNLSIINKLLFSILVFIIFGCAIVSMGSVIFS